MSKFSIIILLCALVASYGQTSDIAEYCQALAGELAACKQYLAECEAQRKDFAMRSEDRERAIAAENAKLKAEIERLRKQKHLLSEEKQKLAAEQQQLHECREACLKTLLPAEQALEAKRQQLPWWQDYVPAIAQAIEISSGKRPPALLPLPVTIKGDGQ